MKKTIVLVPSVGFLSALKDVAKAASQGVNPKPEIRSTVSSILRRKQEIGKVVVLMGAYRGRTTIGPDKVYRALKKGGFKGKVTVIDEWDWKIPGQVLLKPGMSMLKQIKACLV